MKAAIWIIIIILLAIGAWYIFMPRGGSQTPYPTYSPSPSQDPYPPAPSSTVSSGTQQHVSGPGGRCGGNMMNPPVCSAGYHCAPKPGSPVGLFGDIGGICVKN